MQSDQPEAVKRLAQLDAQRKEERDRKRQEQEDARNPAESTEKFLEAFLADVSTVRKEVEGVEGEGEAVRAKCDAWMVRLSEMEDRVSQAAFYLPPFDVRQSRGTLTELKKKVEDTKARLAPRKRFQFSKKSHGTKAPPRIEVKAAEELPPSHALTQRSLDGRVGEDVWLGEDEMGSRGFSILNCSSCTVRLEGTLLALQLRDLIDCTVVVVGHVKGATMMFGLRGCTVCLASAQIRIHESRSTKLCLRVRSHPVIENCTEMRFGALTSEQPEILAQEERSRLAEAADALCSENGLWAQVQDFSWLRQTRSPNWCCRQSN